jgi:hypothetical protein
MYVRTPLPAPRRPTPAQASPTAALAGMPALPPAVATLAKSSCAVLAAGGDMVTEERGWGPAVVRRATLPSSELGPLPARLLPELGPTRSELCVCPCPARVPRQTCRARTGVPSRADPGPFPPASPTASPRGVGHTQVACRARHGDHTTERDPCVQASRQACGAHPQRQDSALALSVLALALTLADELLDMDVHREADDEGPVPAPVLESAAPVSSGALADDEAHGQVGIPIGLVCALGG